MTREALLNILENVMVHAGRERHQARAILEQSSTFELQNQFYCAVAAKTVNADGSMPSAAVPEARPEPSTPTATWADVERAKQELQRDRTLAEERRLDQQLRRDATVAAQQTLREIRERDRLEPQDRNIFADAAKTLRFGMNEANFSLIRQVLGAGFSVYSIQQAISSNALQLSPATQAELDQWQAEDVEAHNAALLAANPVELRNRVKVEAADRRAQAQQEAAAETARVRSERDALKNFPPLPEFMKGQRVDSSFIKRASRDDLRYMIRRWGETQVTNRLRGIDSAQPKGE